MYTIIQRSLRAILFSAAVAFFLPSSANAQDVTKSPKTEVKATIGVAFFDDDRDDDLHLVWGGSFRYNVTPRLGFEPEFLYMRHSAGDQDIVFTPNVAFDFRKAGKTFVPYGSGGVGVIHNWGKIKRVNPQNKDVVETTSRTAPNFNFGFGVKIFLNDRVFITPELRFGFEPLVRLTVSGGYVLSERIK